MLITKVKRLVYHEKIEKIVYQPLTLYPSPLTRGRGKGIKRGEAPFLIPLINNLG
jgi:hypothetical protein